MNIDILKVIGIFILLLLAQAMVFNHIHLFNCATPLPYVYVAMLFRRDFPRWGVLVMSFAMGLSVDIFSNTPGLASASMTLIGLLQPILLVLFLPRESPANLVPSMRSLGTEKFIWFSLILLFVYCLTFFALEAFNFNNWLQWLMTAVGSFVVTGILLLAMEFFRCRMEGRV